MVVSSSITILLRLMIYFVSFLQTSSTMSIFFASTVKHCDDNIQLLSCKLSTKYFRSIIAVLKDSKMQNCKRNISSISRRDDFKQQINLLFIYNSFFIISPSDYATRESFPGNSHKLRCTLLCDPFHLLDNTHSRT